MSHFSNNDSYIKSHETLKKLAGNAVWVPEFTPRDCMEKTIIKLLLHYFYIQNVCCAVVGTFPLYLANKISFFDSVDVCVIKRVKYNTKLKCFLFGTRKHLHFNGLCCVLLEKGLFKITYKITYQSFSVLVVLRSVPSHVEQIYNRSMSLNLLKYIWHMIPYKALCLGIFTLPNSQICYTHIYDSNCGWGNRNPLVLETNIVNARSLKSTCEIHHKEIKCSLCIKNPPSLKALSSNVLFTCVFNLKEFEFVNNISYNIYKSVTENSKVSVCQLVPFQPPFTLVSHYAICELIKNKRVHKNCIDVPHVWLGKESTYISNENMFVKTVITHRDKFWCASCNKPLFSIYKHGMQRIIAEW